MSSNPADHVSREFSAKNAPTSMKTGGRWLVAASREIFFYLKNFTIIFGFSRIFILPSVNLCRVLFRHSAKALLSARQKTLGKEAFAVKGYADRALPSAKPSLPSAIALGKARVCCNVYYTNSYSTSVVQSLYSLVLTQHLLHLYNKLASLHVVHDPPFSGGKSLKASLLSFSH